MAARATLREVALDAGVSPSTVSRALAGNPAISKQTRDRVFHSAAKLNYVPNLQARGLRSAASTAVGLTIPSLVNPFFAQLAASIQQAADTDGFSVMIATTNEDAGQLDAALQTFSGQQLAGAIIVPSMHSAPMVQSLLDRGQMIVQVDRVLPGLEVPSVITDARASIRKAVQHLKDNGHTEIGYIAGPSSTSTGLQRLEGFHDAIRDTPETNGLIFRGGYSSAEGFAGAADLLKRGASAIIAGDSMMTVGALQYVLDHKIGLGEDLALVGFDDQPAFQMQPVPLTVIEQHVEDVGRRAWEKIAALIRGEPTSQHEVLPTTLTIRESSNFNFTSRRCSR